MGSKLISFNVDNENLYVSSRVFSFILENTRKVDPSFDFSSFESLLDYDALKESKAKDKIAGKSLVEFFQLCFCNNLGNGDFYMIGNKTHEIHFYLISLLFRLNINLSAPVKNEFGFIQTTLDFQKNLLKVDMEIPSILLLDAKEIVIPILKWVHGFVDRLFQIYLTNKPRASYKGESIEFIYQQNFVPNFDIARYITNEQFFFSRLNNFVYLEQEDGFVRKVEFYLFKDISFSIDEIASKMDISVRALQRKLKEEDTSFRMIKENIRRELSEKYLSDLSLNIQEISEMLAYSERGAFEKAFKKWFGQNPKVFRMRLV